MNSNPLVPMIAGVLVLTVAASQLGRWWVAGVGIALIVLMIWLEKDWRSR